MFPRPLSVLYVGSIFNRRHVVDLIRGFAPIARVREVSLDIVGDNRTYPHADLVAAIASEGIADRVRWHEYVTDAELEDLYSHARPLAAHPWRSPLRYRPTPVARPHSSRASIPIRIY